MNKKAFTLAEFLAVLSVSALVFNASLALAFTALSASKRAAVFSNNFQEASSCAGMIVRDIRGAGAVSPSSTGKALILISGADLITYEYISGKIKRSKNSYGQYITNDGALTSAVFSYPAGGSAAVEIHPAGSSYVFSAEGYCRNGI